MIERGGIRTIPAVVWWATALFFVLLTISATAMPTFQGGDEPLHVDMINTVREGSYPEYDKRFVSKQIRNTFGRTQYRSPAAVFDESGATPRGHRPSFREVAADEPSSWGNQLAQHPPLYYALLAPPSALVAGLPFDQEVALLRVMSCLLALPIPLLAFLTARRLGAGQVAASAAAIGVIALTDFVITGALVNNDALLRLEFAAMALLLARVWTGDTSRRTAGLVGALAGAALLTKGFALVLYPWIALAYVFAMRRGAPRREAALRALMSMGIATVIGGWWWIRNAVLYGRVQPGSHLHPDAPASFHPDWATWLQRFSRALTQSATVYSSKIVLGLVAIGVVVTALFAVAGLRRWSPTPRTHALMLLLPVALVIGILLFGSVTSYRRTGVMAGVSRRYLYIGIVPFAVLAAAAADRLIRTRVAVAALAFALTVTTVEFHYVLRRYWTSTAAFNAWYPFHPAAAGVLALAAVAAALVTLRAAWRLR